MSEAAQTIPAVQKQPRMISYAMVTLLLLAVLLWAVSHFAGVGLVHVETSEQGLLRISNYWALTLANGIVGFSEGVDSIQHPERPIGKDGWSCIIGRASQFQPTQPSGADDGRWYYRFGQRWLPEGSHLSMPMWILPLVAACLTAVSTVGRLRVRRAMAGVAC